MAFFDEEELDNFKEPPPKYLKHCFAWRKIALYDKQVCDLKGKILFFFTFSDKLAIQENWSQRNRLIGQSSVFCFEIGKYTHLLEKFQQQQDEVLRNNCTEQLYITRELGEGNFDFFPDGWCKSFKFHCLPGGVLNSFMQPTKIPQRCKGNCLPWQP